MVEVDLASEALSRVRELLGVTIEGTHGGASFHWRQMGVIQWAWPEPAPGTHGETARRLQLRTPLLEGFSGSPEQLSALSAPLTLPTLAALVRSANQPTRLELASSLEVHCGDIGATSRRLAVAAYVQVEEARSLFSQSKALGLVGLVPAIAPEGTPDSRVSPDEGIPGGPRFDVEASGWSAKELAACIGELKARTQGWVVPVPRGICATFPLGRADKTRSILEVAAGIKHPRLGKGLSVVLTTPVCGGTLDAMRLNGLEVAPQGQGEALGGWGTTRTGLLAHRSFYPDALHQKGLSAQILFASARRARAFVVRG